MFFLCIAPCSCSLGVWIFFGQLRSPKMAMWPGEAAGAGAGHTMPLVPLCFVSSTSHVAPGLIEIRGENPMLRLGETWHLSKVPTSTSIATIWSGKRTHQSATSLYRCGDAQGQQSRGLHLHFGSAGYWCLYDLFSEKLGELQQNGEGVSGTACSTEFLLS